MQLFPPDTMVTAAVTFSRCLYAQLVQQAVQAPDSLSAASQQLPAFQPPAGYPLPSPGSPSRKASELGMKLTAGLEIMCSAKARAERGATPGISPTVRAARHASGCAAFADCWLASYHSEISQRRQLSSRQLISQLTSCSTFLAA